MTVRTVAFLACAALVLAGLWLFMRPGSSSLSPAPTEVTEFHFEVSGGQVTGPRAMTIRQGFPVRITVLSDADDQLHLHGYELWTELDAGEPGALTFPATYSGRFELELHAAELVLGYLDVHPY